MRQGQQLARIGHAVAVGVFPYFEGVERGVLSIDHAVAVAVKFLERFKPVGGFSPVFEQCVVAKQLAP